MIPDPFFPDTVKGYHGPCVLHESHKREWLTLGSRIDGGGRFIYNITKQYGYFWFPV